MYLAIIFEKLCKDWYSQKQQLFQQQVFMQQQLGFILNAAIFFYQFQQLFIEWSKLSFFFGRQTNI